MKTLLTARLPVTVSSVQTWLQAYGNFRKDAHRYPQADICSAPYSDPYTQWHTHTHTHTHTHARTHTHIHTHLIIVCGAPRPTAWRGKNDTWSQDILFSTAFQGSSSRGGHTFFNAMIFLQQYEMISWTAMQRIWPGRVNVMRDQLPRCSFSSDVWHRRWGGGGYQTDDLEWIKGMKVRNSKKLHVHICMFVQNA